jgi:hypothetical protein
MMGSQTSRPLKRGRCVRPTTPSPKLRRLRRAGAVENLPNLWTDTRLPNSTAIPAAGDSSGGEKLDLASKVERYRKEANRCGELAKEATPPFLAEIYRKVAVRYVFMAEELLKGRAHETPSKRLIG